MNGRFFLDTNIFVYAFDQSAPAKLRKAKELVREAVTEQKGVISYQVVQEFLNISMRRFTPPMTVIEAEQYLSTVFRPLLSVHSSLALYVEALQIQAKSSLSWYDSLILAAALQAKCTILYSEDFGHGQRFGGLRVVNPFL